MRATALLNVSIRDRGGTRFEADLSSTIPTRTYAASLYGETNRVLYLLQKGLIRPCISPFSAPVLFTLKPEKLAQ
ncbi:hypothetical protein CLOM_g9114 [Closterium sp. NIES-68]|nr:hypothetical protein CLOM_g9114 [Closterium sp. NIES-68]